MPNGETVNVFDEMDETRPVTRGELYTILDETQEMLTEMKDVVNAQAEALTLNRYLLIKFIPEALLQQSIKEYYEARKKEIEMFESGNEPETDESKLN